MAQALLEAPLTTSSLRSVTRQRGLRGLFLQLGLSALITLGGGLVVGLAKRASWGRLGMVGIVVLSAGVLLFVFALRGRNDAVEVRRRGLVRISGMLGTRIVPFDRIVTIEAIHGRTFFGNQPRESLAMVRVTTKDDQLVTLASLGVCGLILGQAVRHVRKIAASFAELAPKGGRA